MPNFLPHIEESAKHLEQKHRTALQTIAMQRLGWSNDSMKAVVAFYVIAQSAKNCNRLDICETFSDFLKGEGSSMSEEQKNKSKSIAKLILSKLDIRAMDNLVKLAVGES